MNTRTSHVTRRARLAAFVVAAGLLAAACGDDDGDTSASTDVGQPVESAPATTVADESTPTTSATPETTDTTEAADESVAAFPVTIEHKYGSTTIEAEPQRVVSVGFAEHDGILALGVTPVGWDGAGQQISNVAAAEARQAGEIVEDDGETFTKVVAFLENLKVI